MKHTIHHGLARNVAKRATERALAAYAEELAAWNPVVSWPGAHEAKVVCAVMGRNLEARVDVGEADVTFDIDVPFMFRPFQKQAVEIVDREVQRWIAKARAGELDE